jgi:hypothetical protein
MPWERREAGTFGALGAQPGGASPIIAINTFSNTSHYAGSAGTGYIGAAGALTLCVVAIQNTDSTAYDCFYNNQDPSSPWSGYGIYKNTTSKLLIGLGGSSGSNSTRNTAAADTDKIMRIICAVSGGGAYTFCVNGVSQGTGGAVAVAGSAARVPKIGQWPFGSSCPNFGIISVGVSNSSLSLVQMQTLDAAIVAAANGILTAAQFSGAQNIWNASDCLAGATWTDTVGGVALTRTAAGVAVQSISSPVWGT